MAVREGGLCKGGEEPDCEAAYEGSRSDSGYFGASSTRHTSRVSMWSLRMEGWSSRVSCHIITFMHGVM